MLSAWLTGRSANLGDCAQVCRWKYKINGLQGFVEEPKRPGEKIPVEEDQNGTYIFNSKDLCLIEYLPELIDAGITSFKIEGRAKSVAYLSTIVKTYKEGMDIAQSKISKQKKIERSLSENKTKTSGSCFGYRAGFSRSFVAKNIQSLIFRSSPANCQMNSASRKLMRWARPSNGF